MDQLSTPNIKPVTKHKSKVFLVALLFICIALVAILMGVLYLALKQEKPTNQNDEDTNEQNNTNTENDDNTIDLGNDETRKYKFAAIKNDDTIALYTEAGEELIINLAKKSWKNIAWSGEGDYLAVLGTNENSPDIHDLFLYDFEKDEWITITNFSGFPTGVLSYLWHGKSKLFFNQGVVPDNWLHSYDYINKAEVLKVDRIDGQILKKSADETYLLYKMSNNELKLFDFQGDEIWDFKNIKDENENLITGLTNVYFTKDETKVILETLDASNKKHLYKVIVGEASALEITLEYDFTPLCAVNDDVVTGYTIETGFNVVSIINYNIKTGEDNLRAQKDFDDDLQIITESFECLNKNNVLFKVTDTNESNWFSIANNDEIDTITFLDSAKEIESK